MKILIALVVVIAVVGGVYFYMQQPASTPAQNTQQNTEQPSGSLTSNPTTVIEVTGKNYEFDKKEIRVKEGDIVQINFTSESGMHDWVVDEFNARTAQVQTGGKTSVTFSADKKGTFEYYCSVGQHRKMGMVGNLIVE